MTEKLQKFINDSFVARWAALILIALMMFFAYMFVDMLSPLKELLDTTLGWNSSTFGTYAASEYFLNVFCFFLIFAGLRFLWNCVFTGRTALISSGKSDLLWHYEGHLRIPQALLQG